MTTSSVALEKEQQHKRIEVLFYEDEPGLQWMPLLVHTFEQSHCKLIISLMILGGTNLYQLA
jgi:hypothetical protein